MFKRILGILMLLIALIGVILSIVGTYVAWSMVDSLGEGIDTTLELTSDGLDTVAQSLLLTKATVEDVTGSVATVQITTGNLSTTISDTRPLINQVTLVATEDVPNSIQAVQETMPNVAAVAGSIDDALETLSAFQFSQSFLGVNIGFDLGIEYAPEEPFEDSITQVGDSLDGVPDRLRGLEPFLATTNENMRIISENVETLAADLGDINENIENIQPLLDDYLELVYRTNDLIGQTRRGLEDQLRPIKIVIMVLFIWIGLTQVAPLYLGWELFSGSRNDVDEADVEEAVREVMEDMEEDQKEIEVVHTEVVHVKEDLEEEEEKDD